MKILIIGGTRFIGSFVARQLVAMQHQVTLFHRGSTSADLPVSVRHILGDRHSLPDYRSEFEQLAPDVVLDMIPYTQSDAETAIATFTGIAKSIVAISSQDVYRARDLLWGRETGAIEPTPLTEESPLRSQLFPYRDAPPHPEIPSEYDKILVERAYMTASGLLATILRLPMVYGSHDPLHRFLPYLKRMDEGRPAIVLEEQMARWQGSYGYVENVAAAIVLSITNPRSAGRIYNVAEATSLSQAEFIRAIGRAANWKGRVVIVPRSALPESQLSSFNTKQHWTTSSTRIRQELGYTELIPIEEAFKHAVEWQRLNSPPNSFPDAPELLDYEIEDEILRR